MWNSQRNTTVLIVEPTTSTSPSAGSCEAVEGIDYVPYLVKYGPGIHQLSYQLSCLRTIHFRHPPFLWSQYGSNTSMGLR